MKPAPPGLAAAIRAASRHVQSRVRLWPHGRTGDPVDITHMVDSVAASRELAGQLPEEVRLIEGAGAGKCDLALSGASGSTTAATWGRDTGTGPLGDIERLACPVTIDIGITVPGNGIGWCRVFTGTVRAIGIDGATSATLTALDARDTARDPVTIPPVSDRFAGLTLHWCVAYAAHSAGFDAAPSPARLHPTDPARGYWPLAYWPMCGSHAPFIAGPNTHADTIATFVEPGQDDPDPQTGGYVPVPGPIRDQPGAFAGYAGARRWRRIAGTAATHTPNGVTNPPPVTNLRVETWVQGDPATAARAPGDLVRLGVTGAVLVLRGGRLTLECQRRNRTRRRVRFTAPRLDTIGWRAGEWNHIGAHVTIDAAGRPVIIWRCNGSTATATYPHIPVSLGTGGRAEIDTWLPLSGAAVSRAPATAAWLDGEGWAPTALITRADTALSWPGEFGQLTAWEHLTAMADATGSAVHFEANGRLVFAGPPEEPAAPVTEVTTRDRVTSLSVEDSLDRVRNIITVPEQRGSVKRPGDDPLWSDDGPIKIGAGDTAEVIAEFSDPCLKLVAPVVTAAPERGQSWVYADYRKEPEPGDSKPVPARLIRAEAAEVTGTGATIRITNRSQSTVYITAPPGTGTGDQASAIGVCGWWAKPSTKNHHASDAESVTEFGAFPFDDSATPWRQSGGAARAARLLADLAQPAATITGLSIIGDPRLAIGDVITIRDPDGTRLDGAYAITGISDDHTPSSGYTQSLTVHPAPLPIKEQA